MPPPQRPPQPDERIDVEPRDAEQAEDEQVLGEERIGDERAEEDQGQAPRATADERHQELERDELGGREKPLQPGGDEHPFGLAAWALEGPAGDEPRKVRNERQQKAHQEGNFPLRLPSVGQRDIGDFTGNRGRIGREADGTDRPGKDDGKLQHSHFIEPWEDFIKNALACEAGIWYHTPHAIRDSSSTGQSDGFLNRRLGVRVSPVPPNVSPGRSESGIFR